jgi:hypothetical protein
VGENSEVGWTASPGVDVAVGCNVGVGVYVGGKVGCTRGDPLTGWLFPPWLAPAFWLNVEMSQAIAAQVNMIKIKRRDFFAFIKQPRSSITERCAETIMVIEWCTL